MNPTVLATGQEVWIVWVIGDPGSVTVEPATLTLDSLPHVTRRAEGSHTFLST